MLQRVKKIFELEAITGLLLIIATILALLITNSNYLFDYQNFFAIELPIDLNLFGINKKLTIIDLINDFLMAIFFLLIGLELKEEVLSGELSSKQRALLPLICAIGGVIFPALIFYLFNYKIPENLSGIAIPTATDIAFAYGVICIFGKKIPKSLKVFLISLAIFDDLLAIIIIALFYGHNPDFFYLFLSLLILSLMYLINFFGIIKLRYYLFLAFILWILIFKSGIHPVIAGILSAIFIPKSKDCLARLIKMIAPLVNYLILPVFAFANSGVNFEKFSTNIFSEPLFLGIVCGLFFGKQIGVMLFAIIAVKFNFVNLPRSSSHGEVSWFEFYGISVITGIGFTMSFFIGSLAFSDQLILDEVKIAVMIGSLLSTIFAIILILSNHIIIKKNNKLSQVF
jgi:NhaA family Na+:H+ antiporter